jgi:hypothetical protein
MTAAATDDIGALVERLARPHASGGRVIERSVILAEGATAGAIMSWIDDHDGVPDSSSVSTPGRGLHGTRLEPATQASPARRFVLPARAFARPGEDEAAPARLPG